MHYSPILAMAPQPGTPQADQASSIFFVVWLLIIAVIIFLWLRFCRTRPKVKKATGLLSSIAGVWLFFWARAHSPHMGFGEMITKLDSFVLKEPAYYGFLCFATFLTVGGIVLFSQGSGLITKIPFLSGNNSTSHLDEIKKAKELLDSGAIDSAEFEKIKKAALEK